MSVKKSPRNHKFPPIYGHSLQESSDRGELEQFHASQELNVNCAKAITAALAEHYNYSTYCLDAAAACKEVVGKFGFDRMLYVLANTIRHMDFDGRISRHNKEWARTIPDFPEKKLSCYCLVNSNPGLTNLFVNQVRHDYLLTQPLKAADIKAEAARILKEFQSVMEPNSPNGSHFMAQVSPDFLARAKTKDHDRLMELLPFSSLTLSTLDGHKGVYALILGSENRDQPLRLRKPSIKTQLSAKPVPSDQSSKPREQEVR